MKTSRLNTNVKYNIFYAYGNGTSDNFTISLKALLDGIIKGDNSEMSYALNEVLTDILDIPSGGPLEFRLRDDKTGKGIIHRTR